MKIAVLPGDGIGLEVVPQAVKVLRSLERPGLKFEITEAPVGGTALAACGDALPEATLAIAREADAILFGAVGDPRFDHLPQSETPGSSIRRLRKILNLYSNLRPVRLIPALASASSLKPEIIDGLDILIVRELNGDLYYGTPRGLGERDGERYGFNTMHYAAGQVERISHVAFRAARERRRAVCSIDKANVLETMRLWRQVVTEVGAQYPDVALSHMLVDSAAMQLVRDPCQFDVLLAPNMFGDILSDEASMLTGSIGMLPSGSLGEGRFGLYEPVHGSAPDLAGQDKANPIATILSAAMLLRHSLDLPDEAARIERAVETAIGDGLRTADIARADDRITGTEAAGTMIADALA